MSLENQAVSGYKGYKEIDPRPALDELKAAGLEIHFPPRIFALQTTNRALLYLHHLIYGSPFTDDFRKDKEFYGIWSRDKEAIFTRDGDLFTLEHELAHVWLDLLNPQIYQKSLKGYLLGVDREEPFILQAINEGSAQWVAIRTALGSRDSERRKRAMGIHQLMVAGVKENNALQTAQKGIESFCSFRSQVDLIMFEEYQKSLGQTSQVLTCLGYTHIINQIPVDTEHPQASNMLRSIIQNPPTRLSQLLVA